jgi:hypothetical protein
VIDATTIKIIIAVYSFFEDAEKTQLWLRVGNPMFGGVAPLKLMNMGRGKKVLKVIEESLAENSWELPGREKNG